MLFRSHPRDLGRGKAYVILDGTLLRIDRVGMTGGRDRPYYSGKHECHGLDVQVIADPAGQLIWISLCFPGLATTWVPPASTESSTPSTRRACRRWPTPPAKAADLRSGSRSAAGASTPTPTATGASPVRRGQHRPRPPPRTGRASHSELKNWRILRKIRPSPSRANTLVKAVQALILAG